MRRLDDDSPPRAFVRMMSDDVMREGWVLLKTPRGDIDGVGEVKFDKVTVTSEPHSCPVCITSMSGAPSFLFFMIPVENTGEKRNMV